MILAHGVGALSGLPLERWQFAWGVAAIVVITFFAVNSARRRPVREDAPGRPFPAATRPVFLVVAVALRVVGVVVYVTIITAGLFGSEFPPANLATIGVLTVFWVGLQLVSMVLGDVWRVLSPFETLALVGAWVRARARHEPLAPATVAEGATHWAAAAIIAGFVGLELAYHSPTTPRILGLLGLLYGVAVLAVAAVRGRGWLRTGEGFAVLFGLFATLSPFARLDEGRLGVRSPLRGLRELTVRSGTMPLLFVVLGAAVFDGLARTRFWFDLTVERVGWGYTAVNSLGLVWTIGIVALVYMSVTRVASWVIGEEPDPTAARFAPLLVPVAAAYTVAHYFAALVLDGQGFWFLASDPYGEGWDLFGTADGTVDFGLVSAATIAWVQAAAIALGHGVGVVVAHDRAVLSLTPRKALLAQYVLLPMLVGSSVAAVALLLGS